MRGTWGEAFAGKKIAPLDKDVVVKTDERKWWATKRFWGATIFTVGSIVKLFNTQVGDIIVTAGSILFGYGAVTAVYKSKPEYNGSAGFFYKVFSVMVRFLRKK